MNYNLYKVAELQKLCKEKGVKGYSGKKKDELIALLSVEPAPVPLRSSAEVIIIPKPATLKPAAPLCSPPPLNKPNLSHRLFGFEKESDSLFSWFTAYKKGKPYPPFCLYGPSGIGKTFFVHEFFKALCICVKEDFESDDIENKKSFFYDSPPITPSVFVFEYIDKAPKPVAPLAVPLVLIGREKPTGMPKESVLAKLGKPPSAALAKWLVAKFPGVKQEEIASLVQMNEGDIRHILLTLESGFIGDLSKDTLVQKDAFSATAALFNTGLSFEKRCANATLELDMTTCLIHDGMLRCGASLEDDLLDAYSALSLTDCMRHQDQKAACAVSVVGLLGADKPPFFYFPPWYGKYSKTEKHKRWLADWRRLGVRGGYDLDSMLLFREALCEKGGALADAGASLEEIALATWKTIKGAGVKVENVFEELEEFLLEGNQVSEFDSGIVKAILKIEKENN